MTNSISARQRWAESHFLRMSVINNVLENVGMKMKEDITSKLRPHIIKNDNECVTKIGKIIKENLNPFNMSDQNHLFNIASGKSAHENTDKFLLNIVKLGDAELLKFVSECIESPERFEKPIKRQTLHTFATESGRKKLETKDGKLMATCLLRDLLEVSCSFLYRRKLIWLKFLLTHLHLYHSR